MEYNYTAKDVLGNTISIDNLVCEWQYAGYEKDLRKEVLNAFQRDVDEFDILRDCKLDRPTAGKYSWFKNSVWGDGLLVRWDKFRTLSKSVETRAILQIEVNPNKHWGAPVLQSVLRIVREKCTHGTLRKFDVAVDVPVRMEHVRVESRKKRAVVKGTQYYGERNKHGHLRVYDKKAEVTGRGSSVDSDELTRLEWTFSDGKPMAFDEVGLRFFDTYHRGYGELSSNARMAADLCAMLMEKGVEWSEIEPFINRATRKKIETAARGACIRLVIEKGDIYGLIDQYCCELMITYRDEESNYIQHGFVNQATKMVYPGL